MDSEPTEEVQVVSEVAEVPERSGIIEVQEISEQTKKGVKKAGHYLIA